MKRTHGKELTRESLPVDFRPAFAGIAAVLSANAISLGFHVYERFPDIDIPLHVSGGFFVGLFAILIRDEQIRRGNVRLGPWWYDLIFVVGFVAIVAIFWELHEYLLDASRVADHLLVKTQLSLGDTVDDLINGMIGGAFALWIHKNPRE